MMTTADFLRPDFLEAMMRAHAPERNIRVLAVAPLPLDSSASILATLTAGQTETAIGHFGLAVTLEADGQPQTQRLVLKVKPPGREISAMLGTLAQACGEPAGRGVPGLCGAHRAFSIPTTASWRPTSCRPPASRPPSGACMPMTRRKPTAC